jgi:hypothetical protein
MFALIDAWYKISSFSYAQWTSYFNPASSMFMVTRIEQNQMFLALHEINYPFQISRNYWGVFTT